MKNILKSEKTISRRRLLASGVAALFAPAVAAQTAAWSGVRAAAAALPQCHAVLILQDGESVLRETFRGPPEGRAVPIKSVSKSIVAALTGAAIDRGEIRDVRATLGQVSPGLIPQGADPGVAGLTIENLVTLQAGLERTSGANYGEWVSSANWVANALSRPFVATPGARMLYSTGSTHVLGAVLADVSGQSLLQLARDRLGAPLGFDVPAWTRDPQGRYLGGNEMALTLDAMALIGEMYRLGGRWQGRQVISTDWIRQSMTARTRSPFSGMDYGYGWFLGRTRGDAFALARGYGGQIIFVMPARRLTIALTSDPTRPARSGGYFGDLMQLIEGHVVPSAQTA
ncbi:MAG: serine hydrolase domain-containing protein [Roseobacter sp.]